MEPQTSPPAAAKPAPSTPLASDLRFEQWAEKGKTDQAAFKEKARIIALGLGVAVVATAILAWIVYLL